MSILANLARFLAVASMLIAAGCEGQVVARHHDAACASIDKNYNCALVKRRWMIDVQLDPSDTRSRQWMEVTKAVYNLCGVGANYPECRGNQ